MKNCSRCNLELPLDLFAKRSKSEDGLQRWCKPCQSEHYRQNYNGKKQKYKDSQTERFERNRKFIREIKEGRPCADCGISFPYFVMDFDHLDPETKTLEVSIMVTNGYGLDKIMAEVLKCDVVCSNCHRFRTHKRLHMVE